MHYCLGRNETGEAYALRDPREAEIAGAVAKAGDHAPAIAGALMDLPVFVPQALAASPVWRDTVTEILGDILEHGMRPAIEAEAARIEAS
jgi:fructuronate reductase